MKKLRAIIMGKKRSQVRDFFRCQNLLSLTSSFSTEFGGRAATLDKLTDSYKPQLKELWAPVIVTCTSHCETLASACSRIGLGMLHLFLTIQDDCSSINDWRTAAYVSTLT